MSINFSGCTQGTKLYDPECYFHYHKGNEEEFKDVVSLEETEMKLMVKRFKVRGFYR